MINQTMNAFQAPAQAWQEAASQFIECCEEKLWSDDGRQALEYLHSLGLQVKVIQDNHLGYNPQDRYDAPLQWGLGDEGQPSIWLPKGITLPCFIAQQRWYIKIRSYGAFHKDMHVKGGRPALVGADKLVGCRSVALVVDGEFDRLIAQQFVGRFVDVVSFGNVYSRPVVDYWKKFLLPVKTVLLAFSADELGIKHSQFLRQFVPQSYPIPIPVLKSGNTNMLDYVLAGGNLRSWLLYHLDLLGIVLPATDSQSLAADEPHAEGKTVLVKLNQAHEQPWKLDISRPCFACGGTNFRAYPNGDGHFCATCHPVYCEDNN